MDISAESGQGTSEAQQNLDDFWNRALEDVKQLKMNDFRTQDLPLARIKKIMKLDEDVKMISAEAPALFAKAAEFFISELTLRAWVLAEENKRRTLQRNDVATAISKFDQFDFLIDIVPREEVRPNKRAEDSNGSGTTPEQVQYFFQVTPQQQQQGQGQIIQSPIQILTGSSAATSLTQTITESSVPVIQLQAPIASMTTPTAASSGTQITSLSGHPAIQVFTQTVTPGGEVQQFPVQLTPSQIQTIQSQMQGKAPNQPIVIQTSVEAVTSGANEGVQFVPQL